MALLYQRRGKRGGGDVEVSANARHGEGAGGAHVGRNLDRGSGERKPPNGVSR